MTIARGGTSPRSSTGSSPRTSMIGVEAVSTTLAPSTASRPTRTPSTTMQREPTKAPSSTITGRGLQRLEDAADADAAGEVHVGADLRARADGGPGVDHRARAHPGADVDVGGHEHDAGGDVGALADGGRRHDAHAELGPAGLQRHLVVVLVGADLDRLHAAGAEREQDRLLGPLVDVPAGVARRRDAHAAVVEQRQRLLDGGGGLVAQVARRALVELLDLGGEGGQVGGGTHAPDARRSAARRQSAGVGTSAMRTWPSPPGPKYGPGGDDDAVLVEQAQRVALGVLAAGHAQPQEERGVAAGGLQAGRQQGGQQRVALGAVALADLGHVVLVGPRRRGRALDEGLRRDADVRAVALERGDDRGVAGGEPGAIAGHRGALGERVEDDDVRAVGQLQGADRRVALEPQLRVGLVGGEDEVVLARQRGGALVELGRRRGRRRVVGVVQPQQRDAVPVDGVEVGLPAARGVERELDHLARRRRARRGPATG